MRYLACLLGVSAALVLLSGCPDKKPKYPNCKGDDDCQEGEVCVDQRCQQCADADDCPAGQTCEEGACVAEAECTTDDDCEGGKICENNQCVACEEDGQCGEGGRCNNGVCLEPGACEVDEDCADDEDCIDGKCQRPWMGKKPDEVSCELQPIHFGFDQATIDEEQGDVLNGNAECIKEAEGDPTIQIMGHTDPRGTEEYNIALSERRANTVADYLARLGIDPARFFVIGKGETEATGSSEAGWAEDRRVEFSWGGRSRP